MGGSDVNDIEAFRLFLFVFQLGFREGFFFQVLKE